MELEPEELDEPMPGQCPLGIEPEPAPDGPEGAAAGVVSVDEPVPVEAELVVPLDPELVEVDVVVGEPDVAAKATVVPAPARTPATSRPAMACLVRILMSVASF